MSLSLERMQGIREFVAVARAASFTRASEQLALSRSAVGKSIAALESRLGVQLLLRSTRHVQLTAEGELFLQHCQRILHELSLAEAGLKALQADIAGEVRLSLPVQFGRRWVMPVLLRLARQHPDLHFDVRFSNELCDLEQEQIDFAVRIGQLADNPLRVSRFLGHQSQLICGAPALLQSFGSPRRPSHLQNWPCVKETAEEKWFMLDEQGDVQPFEVRGVMVLDEIMARFDAACQGIGLARLPGWLANDAIRSGKLQSVLDEAQPQGLPVHVLWSTRHPLNKRQHLILDALQQSFLQTGF